jgi:hypothetical protein
MPSRNLTDEQFLEAGDFEVACGNKHAGCTSKGSKKSIDKHEQECMFRRYTYVMFSWNTTLTDYYSPVRCTTR